MEIVKEEKIKLSYGDKIYIIHREKDSNENKVYEIEITEDYIKYKDSLSRSVKTIFGKELYNMERSKEDKLSNGSYCLFDHSCRTEGAGIGEHPVHSYEKSIVGFFVNKEKALEEAERLNLSILADIARFKASQRANDLAQQAWKEKYNEVFPKLFEEEIYKEPKLKEYLQKNK